jgi:type IV secretion system protein VirB10
VLAQATIREAPRDPNAPTVSTITPTVRPRTLWRNENRLLEGTQIEATLETPVSTAGRGGILRATIQQDVYAASGARVLIRKGDQVLGRQAQAAVELGQDLIPLTWHRIISRTENLNGPSTDSIIDIPADSQSGDPLGRTGHQGNIDTHFSQRVGYGLLYSIIGAGASNVGSSARRGDSASAQYRTDVSRSLATEAQQSLEPHQNRVADPTITVPRAIPIAIIVARDILFEEGQVEGTRR